MVRAHEGVPKADLPGYMPLTVIPKARPNDLVAQRPSADVGGPARRQNNVLFDNQTTGSNPPRPKVGMQQRNPEDQRSLIDVILGR